MKNEEPLPAIILLGIGIVVFVIWQFSRSIGADFQITFEALFKSLGVLGFTFVVWWLTRPEPLLLVSGCAIFLWPVWWPVLESIAAGGQKPDTWLPPWQLAVWWNTGWFRWSIEVGLALALIYLLVQRSRDPYGFF